jgi:hypothetical protein
VKFWIFFGGKRICSLPPNILAHITRAIFGANVPAIRLEVSDEFGGKNLLGFGGNNEYPLDLAGGEDIDDQHHPSP